MDKQATDKATRPEPRSASEARKLAEVEKLIGERLGWQVFRKWQRQMDRAAAKGSA